MTVKRMMTMLLVLAALSALGWSQETEPQKATGEQEQSTGEAGSNEGPTAVEEQLYIPDSGTVQGWEEFLADWLTPKPFPKKQVLKINDEFAYPHLVASIVMKIVRENDEYVWLVGLPPEDPRSPLHRVWARREADEALMLDRAEYLGTAGAVNFLDFGAENVPPPFMESLRFEAVSENLPTDGRWQMSFAVADMNEDGHPDLIFPPRRKGYPVAPVIFLGDGKGGFSIWRDARRPILTVTATRTWFSRFISSRSSCSTVTVRAGSSGQTCCDRPTLVSPRVL